MSPVTVETLRVFSGGVDQSVPPQQLPPERASGGKDLAFRAQAGGGLALSARPGTHVRTTHPLPITSLATWAMEDRDTLGNPTGTTTKYLFATDDDDNFNQLEPTVSSLSGVTLSNTAGGVRYTPARGALYGATAGGSMFRVAIASLSSTTLELSSVGLELDASVLLEVSVGGTGDLATGTYEVAYSWYDNVTDTESNRSAPTSVSVETAGQELTIGFPVGTTAPTNATHVNIYVRRGESMTLFWRDATMRYEWSAFSASGCTLDPTLDELAAMITSAPSRTENSLPPTRVIDVCWHQSRMFVTDGTNVYYSALNHPEQFDPEAVEYPNSADGQLVSRLWSLGLDRLAIIKERSIYVLEGDSPQSWTLRKLTGSYGLIAPNSLCECDGVVFGWGEAGPWRWARDTEPEDLSDEIVYPRWRDQTLVLHSTQVLAASDPVEHRVVFFPEVTEGVVLTAIPYHVGLGIWESEGWRLGSPTTTTTGLLDSGVQGILFAGTTGEVLELDATCDADGVSPRPVRLTVNSSNGTTNQLAMVGDPSFTPRTTNSKLLYINASLNVTEHSYSYNAGTKTFTISPELEIPVIGGTVAIDQPVPEWESKTLEGARAGGLKRYLYLDVRSETTATGQIGIIINAAPNPARVFALRPLMHQRVAALGHECRLRMVWTGNGRIFDVTLLSELIHDRR